ncbi:hypothetical protein [Chitinasiproducens palmae]|uniref:hypothetical protein n=1 Tax=Chitinasiproducens palmae TaxID=1770053 RepID=UPI000B84282E|nr:hypothetical protein [Chitinasiproducens palmae]
MKISEVYGDGVAFRQCLLPNADGVQMLNVSAGNILARDGSMNKDSNGGGVFFWGCVGGSCRDHFIWNTRRYLASVVSPENGQQIQGTLCGYIAAWAEYPVNVSDQTPAPPFDTIVQAHSSDNDLLFIDERNRMVLFENGVSYGYVIGLKTEAGAYGSVRGCMVLNAYLPIFCSGTPGIFEGCYVDMLDAGSVLSPQKGFESIRAHIVGHQYATGSTEGPALLGLTVRDNFIHAKSAYPAFSFDRDAMNVTGGIVWWRGTVGGALVNSANVPSRGMRANRLSGVSFLYGDSTSVVKETNFANQIGFSFDGNALISYAGNAISIVFPNAGAFSRFNAMRGNAFHAAVTVKSTASDFHSEGNQWHRTVTNPGGSCLIFDAGATRSKSINDVFDIPSTVTAWPIDATPAHHTIRGARFYLTDGGAPGITYLIRNVPGTARVGAVYEDIHVAGDNHDLALVGALNLTAPTFRNCSSDGAGCLLVASGTTFGPMTVENVLFGGGLTNSSFAKPNTSSRLASDLVPYPGMRLPPYLRPAAGGAEGELYVDAVSGWKKYGSVGI